jgi:hypothetical protein
MEPLEKYKKMQPVAKYQQMKPVDKYKQMQPIAKYQLTISTNTCLFQSYFSSISETKLCKLK